MLQLGFVHCYLSTLASDQNLSNINSADLLEQMSSVLTLFRAATDPQTRHCDTTAGAFLKKTEDVEFPTWKGSNLVSSGCKLRHIYSVPPKVSLIFILYRHGAVHQAWTRTGMDQRTCLHRAIGMSDHGELAGVAGHGRVHAGSS